jgi:glutamate synthase (ferredoxin)
MFTNPQLSWSLPPRQGLYDPRFEHDACGIGFVAHVEGRRSHRVLEMGLEALRNHAHRGAVADDRKTGDGAGILTQIPHEFFSRELRRMSVEPPAQGDLAVGQIFFHKGNGEDRAMARDLIQEILTGLKLEVLAFRSVPVIESALGQRALYSRPWLGQVLVRRADAACDAGDAFERLLYVARKRIISAARARGVQRLYISSLSSRTIVYKGLMLAEELAHFYPDLSDPEYKTAIAVFHQRYSTNTFPTWERAQPFRLVCHNGEINTLQGNEVWMRAREADLESIFWDDPQGQLLPITEREGSDSGKFDNVLELLVRGGRDIRHAIMMMAPEAWERLPDGEVTPERRAFYEYHSALMEPWDGPAALTYTDGRVVGTAMDRNGLRPARYVVLDNGLVICASEVGAVAYDEGRVIRKGRIAPGQVFCVDTTRGVIMDDEEITQKFAARRPYDKWLKENLVHLDDLAKQAKITTNGHAAATDNGANHHPSTPLSNRQASFGYTSEELIVILRPMLTTGNEPVGAMGDDTPPAAMSKLPRPIFSYFKQRFAEVTNPPIDPLREELVMSLRVLLGKRANVLSETPAATRLIALKSPILLPDQVHTLHTQSLPEFATATVAAVWPAPAGEEVTPESAGAALRAAVAKLCRDAEDAVREGARILFISDEQADIHTLPIPAMLAVGAVHHHLIRHGLRMRASLVSVSGEPREVHHFAALIGYGANAVYPYLAYATVSEIVREGRKTGNLTVEQARKNFVKAVDKGLLKVMSKMGISTIDAYCGAQIFEALGIGQELLDVAFVDTPSVLGGVGFDSVAEDVLAWHTYGYPNSETAQAAKLVTWGIYKSRRGGEVHEWNPQVVHALTMASRPKKAEDAPANYRKYADLANASRVAPRHLLSFRRTRPAIPVTQVEPVERILRRFSTAAMSLGALGPEAHETLAIAMNRLGGMSNSGEGGESKDRYFTERASKIKQVASGRFGVTPEYLMSAEELQIKMAQGSKPGEGGQLPGHKVTAEIAILRHSTPGVALISPPPHHDIYSIEDLAQLIYDLKAINPNAKISVKLVSEMGVGTIAAGVAKGLADVIHLSGASGGTGASPLSSIKHAGLPWEIGLAETHQVLLANGLRTRVTVRTDGGLATGRDVVMATMLGADEVSFGTSAMIAEGCIMARVCHKNTCPVGVATQDPELRKKFTGTPEDVIRFMTAIAEDVRAILADLGFRSLDEVVGHPEYLEQVIHGREAGFLDLAPLLYVPDTGTARRNVLPRNEVIPPDPALSDRITEQVLASLQANPDAPIHLAHKIRNTERTVGARASGQLALRYGDAGLPEGQIRIDFEGMAGQSFGAFAIRGLSLRLWGAANDYVGKGLGGGEIVLRPAEEARFVPHQSVILGNTALYGATAGKLFAAGVAGERFGVRNSGATAVIEGAGEHCCEYMTGGCVVVLGETGRNFGAGMTGGHAYVYDINETFERRYNSELIALSRLVGDGYEQFLKTLIVEHLDKTGSPMARLLLDNWETQRHFFWHIMPKDNVVQIEAATEGSAESEDEEEAVKA